MNPNEIYYRKANINDIETIIKYRIDFLKELQTEVDDEGEKILKIQLNTYFTKTMNDQTFIVWIAEQNNMPVGFGGLIIREIPGHFTLLNGKTGYILNMYTIPSHRKKGICTKIFSYLLQEAKNVGIGKIELHATPEGEKIYRNFGFTNPHDLALDLFIS